MILNPLDGVYGSLIKFALVVALVGGLYGGYKYQLHKSFQEGVKTTEIRYEAQILAQNEVLNLKKKAAEKEIEKDFTKRQGEYNAKINNLNTTVSGLLASLQQRPSRTDSTGGDSATTRTEASPAGAYPSQLYREDATSFVNFARDAEEIRLGLLQCYADYDAAKKSIELFTEKK